MATPRTVTAITPLTTPRNTVVTDIGNGTMVYCWTDNTTIWGQTFDAALNATSAPFAIVTVPPGSTFNQPQIASAGDGTFEVVYRSGFFSDRALTAIRVDSAGNLLAGPSNLVTASGLASLNNETRPIAIDPATGEFAEGYRNNDGFGRPSVVFANADGTIIANAAVTMPVNQFGAGGLQLTNLPPSVIHLAGGNFGVAFQVDDQDAGNTVHRTSFWFALYRPDGTFISSSLIGQAPPANSGSGLEITALADGGFAATFAYTVAGSNDFDVSVQAFNANGSPRGAPTILTNAQQPQIAALSTGQYTVMWSDARLPPGTPTSGQQMIWNSDGSAYGTAFTVSPGHDGGVSTGAQPAQVVATPNGGFIDIFANIGTQTEQFEVAYTLAPEAPRFSRIQPITDTGATGDQIKFFGYGTPGDTITVNDHGTQVAKGTVLPDSTFVVWTKGPLPLGDHDFVAIDSNNLGLSSPATGDIAYKIIGGSPNSLIVTSNGDGATILATEGNDYLTGGSGADQLTGNGGDDTLDGGAGIDTMTGGEGSDTYYVDNEFDIVKETGKVGSDNVVTSVSYALPSGPIEFLHAAPGAPGLHLTGNNGANFIYGGSGDDTLIGGGGRDQLYGGLGADTFLYRNLADLTGGSQIDFLTSDNDKIDLSLIDAMPSVAGLQHFNFLGTAQFTGAGGELRATTKGTVTTISGDWNGDKITDFTIKLMVPATLSVTDFKLS